MATGNEIVFQVTYTPAKPQNIIKGEKLKKYYDQRKFYSCNQSDDILYYASHGNTKDILSYSGNKNKSFGIFGQNGELTARQIMALKVKLQNTDSCIWHGFISFEEEFGIKNCNSLDSTIRFMQRNFKGRFISKTHLNPENVTWIATLHENTENYHIHFLFFEKEPKIFSTKAGSPRYTSRGKINGWAIKSAKTEFYNYFLTKSFGIHNVRDEILAEIKQKYLSPKIHDGNGDKIFRQLKMLSLKLPDKGSLKYGSENMKKVRIEIDGITSTIINSDSKLSSIYKNFCSAVLKRDNELADYGDKTNSNVKNMLFIDSMRRDIYSRIGSKIIDSALYIRKTRKSPIDKQIPRFFAKSLRRGKRKSMLREYAYLLNRINDTALDCFEEYLKNLARAEEEQIKSAKEIERGSYEN